MSKTPIIFFLAKIRINKSIFKSLVYNGQVRLILVSLVLWFGTGASAYAEFFFWRGGGQNFPNHRYKIVLFFIL